MIAAPAMNDTPSPSEPAAPMPPLSGSLPQPAGAPPSPAAVETVAAPSAAETVAAPSPAETVAAPSAADRRVKARYLLLSLVVLFLDQASKWLVETRLPEHETLTLIPGLLNFVHVRNTGVAFGLFPAHGDLRGTLMLAGLGFFALAFVFYYFWSTPAGDRPLLLSLAGIIGGAIGNLIDRLASGGVTDFVDFHFQGYHWHTFNIADSAITIGICLMLLTSLRPARGEEAAPSASPAG